MKINLLVSDTGPLFSLAVTDSLFLIKEFTRDIFIPTAVWDELLSHTEIPGQSDIISLLKDSVKPVSSKNHLKSYMDLGESEACLLYLELNADLLLIDDKIARSYADKLGIRCIGTLGMLLFANENSLIPDLRSRFIQLLTNNRYYSLTLLNQLLSSAGENQLSANDLPLR